jgi:hypothetical protein
MNNKSKEDFKSLITIISTTNFDFKNYYRTSDLCECIEKLKEELKRIDLKDEKDVLKDDKCK